MNKKYVKRIYSILIILVSLSCHNGFEKEVEESKRVGKLIKEEELPNYDSVYNLVCFGRKDFPTETIQADSLYHHTIKFDHLIDSLINVIEKKDPSGARRDLGKSLFIDSSTDNQLTDLINKIYSESIQSFSRRNEVEEFEKQFAKYKKRLDTGEFDNIFIPQSSSAFIILVLRSIKSALIKAAAEGLYDIHVRMTE